MEADPSDPYDDEKLAQLSSLVTDIVEHLILFREKLSPYLLNLTPKERQSTLKAPIRFNEAGRQMVSTSQTTPHLLAACPTFDGPRVISALELAEILAPLAEHAEMLARLSADTRHKHLGDAYGETLQLYRVGKAMGEHDPKILEVIRPLTEIFANRRKPKKEGEPE